MWYFLGGIVLLILGYMSYGRFIERILAPTDKPTPAVAHPDGVDYLVLPAWKNMLIQLLNIAGIGPVIGVILGIKFGEIVFLIIPLGNIIGGATHDFLGGMMSIRNNGTNLPNIIRRTLGQKYYYIFSAFMAFLLLLVVAVFINVPANLIKSFNCVSGEYASIVFWGSVILIFLYYICATLFPVDKIIGRFYPIFGLMLLLGTAAIFVALVIAGFKDPSILSESAAFRENMWTAANNHPVIPLLFVTIACGIISGFHATQSPIVARTMRSEKQARSTFYGMMITEGAIAMIWAAAGLAIYNWNVELMGVNPSTVLSVIANHFLGTWVGGLTVAAVIILAVTSGDTAMRSLRLSLAEIFSVPQKKIQSRIFLSSFIIVFVALLLYWSNTSAKSFQYLWNYFAWGNQVLAVFTLFAAMVWLRTANRIWIVAAVPACFMCFIVISFILWTSPAVGGPFGCGLPLNVAEYFAAAVTFLVFINFLMKKSDPDFIRR